MLLKKPGKQEEKRIKGEIIGGQITYKIETYDFILLFFINAN